MNSMKNGNGLKEAQSGEALEVQPLNAVPMHPTNATEAREGGYKEDLLTLKRDDTLRLEWHSELPPEPSVVLAGTAKGGSIGRPIGQVDIAESSSAFLFRVSLPGVDNASVKCDIERCGKITVHGVTRTGDAVRRGDQIFCMKSRNLPPSGNFTVSFDLPGPVENRAWVGTINHGLLEGIVGKSFQ